MRDEDHDTIQPDRQSTQNDPERTHSSGPDADASGQAPPAPLDRAPLDRAPLDRAPSSGVEAAGSAPTQPAEPAAVRPQTEPPTGGPYSASTTGQAGDEAADGTADTSDVRSSGADPAHQPAGAASDHPDDRWSAPGGQGLEWARPQTVPASDAAVAGDEPPTPPGGASAGPAGDAHPGQPPQYPGEPTAYPTQQVPTPLYGPAPGYGPPGGPPPYHNQPPGSGWQPGPYGPAQPARPSRSRRWLAAGAAAVVLVLGGGLVGGVTVHALDGNTPVESPVASSPVSNKGGSLADMVKNVQPSVVSLLVKSGQSEDEGSGVIIRSDGMILTNNHVIASVAEGGGSITVTFSNGKQAPARVIGTDQAGDLAVVQAQGQSNLKPATLGDSGKLRVGDGVVAIGSPLGLQGSVTEGIVSALNRSYTVTPDQQQQPQQQNPFGFGQVQPQHESGQSITIPNAIQTDAAINPGNSGGPLVNMAGQVIGINSAIRSSGSSNGQAGNIGIGFAIPINTANATAHQLMNGKKVQHALFGVKVTDAISDGAGSSGTPQGALVVGVTKGGPADKAGLAKGDVITKVDDTQVTDSASLVSVISRHKPGDKITVAYTRDGAHKSTQATLAATPN